MMNIKVFDGEAVCANCKHYYQHYVLVELVGFSACNCGYCSYTLLEDRKPTETCEHFVFKNAID